MDTDDLLGLVEDLEDGIDELEENLEPLLTTALSATTKQLPVLDRAKLYTLVLYTVESLLYSYLKLHGVNVKEHAIWKELTRVKQYFAKIKEVETGGIEPRSNMSLNKQAAGRIIKHALHANDGERAARELKEKLLAKRKLQTLENVMQKKAKHNDERLEAPELSEGEIEEDLVAEDLAQLRDDVQSPGETAEPVEQFTNQSQERPAEYQDPKQIELSRDLRKQSRKLKKQRKKEARQAASQAG